MTSIATSRGQVGMIEEGHQADGTPIIFLHGVGSDKSVWAPQLVHFGATRRAIAFDYPGYGESEYREGATRDDYAAAVLAAMDSLGLRRAHFCGLSLGGVVAIALHAVAPDRCASLIIADSFAVHPEGQAIHDRSVAASQAMSMRELAGARSGALLGSAATDELRKSVVETMSAIDPAAYRIGARAVWLADQTERASAIRVPTLILVGDEDQITPPALSETLHRMISGSQFIRVERAGHLANAEQPDAFNRAVERFLDGVDAGS